MNKNSCWKSKNSFSIISFFFVLVITAETTLHEIDEKNSTGDFYVGLNKSSTVLSRSHFKQNHRVKRTVTSHKDRIWDFGVIPYVIDSIFSPEQKVGFEEATRYWESQTCIKFVKWNSQEHPNFIYFTVQSCGCCSLVGKQNTGSQFVSIGKGCHIFGKIVHELGHAIGFVHEHNRPDRDRYVKIHFENVMRGKAHNFKILSPSDVETFGEPYDPISIMHYNRQIFSKNGGDTIEWLQRSAPKMGQRKHLSRSDIIQTNLLYNCPKCGRTLQDSMASFTSPNYHNSQRENYRCEWRISVQNGNRIKLEITDLEIFGSIDCQQNYLEIRDGYWHKSPLLGRFCGNDRNLPAIMSSSNRMTNISNRTSQISWLRSKL